MDLPLIVNGGNRGGSSTSLTHPRYQCHTMTLSLPTTTIIVARTLSKLVWTPSTNLAVIPE